MVIIIGALLQSYNGTHLEPTRMNIEDERNGGGIFFTLFDCKGFSFLGRSLGGAMLGCFQASKFLGFHCH
jgi:hypothetical protein